MHSSQPTTRQPRHSHGPRRGSTSGGSKIAVSPSRDSGLGRSFSVIAFSRKAASPNELCRLRPKAS